MIIATVLTVPQRQTSGGSVTSSGRVLTSTLCRQTTLLRFCHLDHQLGASYLKSSTSALEPKSIILLLVFTVSVPQTCSGHGRAFSGRCRCDRNYYGDVCQHQVRTWSTCFRKSPTFDLDCRTSVQKTRTAGATDAAGTSEQRLTHESSATARPATLGLAAARGATVRPRSCRRACTPGGTSARS